MSGVHKVRADHRKSNAVPMLCGELHALLELMFKRRRVETTTATIHSVKPPSIRLKYYFGPRFTI